ncbi:unnamed protein product [Diamesa tonsa]
MYRHKEEWSDLKEIWEYDEEKIVKINYRDEFEEVFNYFRAVCAKEEYSERALKLTTHALRLNPHNYNVWDYRRKILKNIAYNAEKELYYVDFMIRETPKNSLAWEHRRKIANLNLSSCSVEIESELTEAILDKDPKSYCAWQHRQWIINTFKYTNSGLFSQELKFTDIKLTTDLRNNSAWNQRWFVVKQRGRVDFDLVKREFSYTLKKIRLALENESSWNYMRGLLMNFGEKNLRQYQDLVDFVEHSYYDDRCHKRHLVAFFIDYKISIVLDLCECNELIHSQKINEMCNAMANDYDTIRATYWKFVYKKFYYDKIKLRYQSNDYGGKIDESWKNKIGKKKDEVDDEFNNISQPEVLTIKTIEVCSILNGTSSNFAFTAFVNVIKDTLPIIHACPYMGKIAFYNVSSDSKNVPSIFPSGTYRSRLHFYDDTDSNIYSATSYTICNSPIKTSF